jgi:hypothetical protein
MRQWLWRLVRIEVLFRGFNVFAIVSDGIEFTGSKRVVSHLTTNQLLSLDFPNPQKLFLSLTFAT